MKRYFCDWCGRNIDGIGKEIKILRKEAVGYSEEEVCPKCNKKIKELSKKIRKDVVGRKHDAN